MKFYRTILILGAVSAIATGLAANAGAQEPAPSNTSINQTELQFIGRWSGPQGYIETHWYGFHYHMEPSLANKVIGGVWTADGAAAVAQAMGAPTAMVVGLLTVGAGALQMCQHDGGVLDVYSTPTGAP
ncbi:hypothetical protein ACFYTQ_29325 [Nocardia sp. NPDC004068]|uniref:hypothetical protein n=1 Tax=Nocardia sp. NPDC004068 TaxID=3364303 RepID=UPI003699B948